MKVGIVALDFTPGKTGGVETYLRDLIAGLQKIDDENEYVVFVRGEAGSLGLASENFSVVTVKDRRLPVLDRPLPSLRRRGSVAGQIESHGCDILHFPYQIIWPKGLSAPKVFSFHDLLHEHMPEFFSERDLVHRRETYPASCAEADHVIAVSEHTRQDLLRYYALPEEKVTTVHNAYSDARFGGSAGGDAGLPAPYFYYPAGSWPHKNHLRLLDAFAEFLATHPGFHLVLTGLELDMTSPIEDAVRRLGIESQVLRLGYRPYDEIPGIYRGACALVYPSMFEGFGIPLLEAMACSCPVAAARAASIPEVAGDAARYFDPEDTAAITAALADVADSPDLRASLVENGLARCQLFSETTMARRTREVYELVAAQARSGDPSTARAR